MPLPGTTRAESSAVMGTSPECATCKETTVPPADLDCSSDPLSSSLKTSFVWFIVLFSSLLPRHQL
jgi:hypothetical protein